MLNLATKQQIFDQTFCRSSSVSLIYIILYVAIRHLHLATTLTVRFYLRCSPISNSNQFTEVFEHLQDLFPKDMIGGFKLICTTEISELSHLLSFYSYCHHINDYHSHCILQLLYSSPTKHQPHQLHYHSQYYLYYHHHLYPHLHHFSFSSSFRIHLPLTYFTKLDTNGISPCNLLHLPSTIFLSL